MQVQVKGPVERRGGIARSARRPFARDARRIGLAVDRPDDLPPLPDDAEDMKTVERRRQRGLVALIFVVRPLPADLQRTEDAVLDSVRTVVAPPAEVPRLPYLDLARRRPAALI